MSKILSNMEHPQDISLIQGNKCQNERLVLIRVSQKKQKEKCIDVR